MSLTINRSERAWLAFLFAYRLSAADELRLRRVREHGATRGQLVREFDEDARLLDDLGWFDRELRDELGIPGAEHEDHELTALTDAELAAALGRAREDARELGEQPVGEENEEERAAREESFLFAAHTCDELLVRLQDEAIAVKAKGGEA
jgi:hypothetical protein